MEKVYDKLVRDNIPNIIIKNGEKPVTKILDYDDFKEQLEKKLYEEYLEVLETKNSEERIEELADMLEIISYLAKIENKKLEDVINVANIKRNKRGGFDNKIFLEKVISDK